MTAIIYQNFDKTITLLDIPRSIELAQGSSKQLQSSKAVTTPFASLEPKGIRRQELLSGVADHVRGYHKSIERDVDRALTEIQSRLTGHRWALSRAFETIVEYPLHTGGQCRGYQASENDTGSPPLLLSAPQGEVPDSSALYNTIVCNTSSSTIDLVVEEDTFYLPCRSTFILSTIADGAAAFLQARSTLLTVQPIPKTFDLILLDPPWANRSVRHAKKYHTAEHQLQDPFDQVQNVLADCRSDVGIVAIWITNKAAFRVRVSEAFHKLQLHLIEEWIWIKTTTQGEPVTEVDGLWRKPYEILLLFSKRERRPMTVKRRIIAAVPDVHSRKPCVKDLIEPLLPSSYRALELFARYLVVGWWSWGDEVLKFQHKSHWTDYTV